ncbi:MAG: hypothetical protein KDC98_08355 [Planctomycetes bacterium]|nr:hypothetical protein [Planctomycetota bacterium]
MTNRDFRDLLAAFFAHEVRFLIVGGYAVSFHARPRFTKDLDVWVEPTATNAARVMAALTDFGAPLQAHGVTVHDFATSGAVYQLGMPPNRVDILTAVEGLEFAPCHERRAAARFADVEVAYVSRQDLIVNKRAVARPQDRIDADELERLG